MNYARKHMMRRRLYLLGSVLILILVLLWEKFT